jgi:hypothetical protein
VFAYERAAQAEADLPGRQRLIEEGDSTYGLPYQEVAFTSIDSRVSNRRLILDVAPVDDRPNHVFDQLPARFGLFAICG